MKIYQNSLYKRFSDVNKDYVEIVSETTVYPNSIEFPNRHLHMFPNLINQSADAATKTKDMR
jgi:hypothetical protein